MKYNNLGRTGLNVSALGFGAATLGDEYGRADEGEIIRCVHAAIDHGINLFDVAPYYGRTLAETRLGNALNGHRSKIILATKCARFDLAGFDFSAEGVTRMADESLRRLKTDYVDIFHVHDIEFGHKNQVIEETLPALLRLQEAGKTRFIGITGLALKMLREVADAVPVDCMLSYCRYTLLNRELARELAPFTQERQIGLMNASPLAMRLLTPAGPPAWHPAPETVRQAAQSVVQLCQERGEDVTAIALRFAMSHPAVASTFVGISTVAELERNLASMQGQTSPELLAEIDRLTAPVQNTMWISGNAENH